MYKNQRLLFSVGEGDLLWGLGIAAVIGLVVISLCLITRLNLSLFTRWSPDPSTRKKSNPQEKPDPTIYLIRIWPDFVYIITEKLNGSGWSKDLILLKTRFHIRPKYSYTTGYGAATLLGLRYLENHICAKYLFIIIYDIFISIYSI